MDYRDLKDFLNCGNKKIEKQAKNTISELEKLERVREKETENLSSKNKFPDEFPFWARLKISKNRTTLVIDEEPVINKKTKKSVEGFVHREATSKYHKGFEEIKPNPDKERAKKNESMFLKSPRKIPKTLVKPHEKKLEMPEALKQRYSKNNKK